MAEITLTGNQNCQAPYGIPITVGGFSDSAIVVIKQIGTGTYQAWNAWGLTTCTNPAGCPADGVNKGYLNVVTINGAAYGNSLVFPNAAIAQAAWNTLYPTGLKLTGATSYTFALPDNAPSDNTGGLVISIVEQSIANAIMFSCNT
jgi:hypothetical protein